ncbi:MAG: hypothetical protein K6A23_07340 [Butyrivibrio sp.]|nr:hypothetical protein [Butyrivibrio sp.]
MNKLWNYVDKKNLKAIAKFRYACILTGAGALFTGFFIYLIINIFYPLGFEWLFCFMGYPFLLSLITVFIYSCKHEFHNNSFYSTKNSDRL